MLGYATRLKNTAAKNRRMEWWIVNEKTLLERCRRDDRQAQRALYDRTAKQIHQLLLRMTGHTEDAFDLAQETYIKAFTRIGQFDGRSSLATWLYKIAVNEALQFLRRSAGMRKTLHKIPVREADRSELERVAVRMDVNDALAVLDPMDRAVLLLRYQEGLDYRTMAQVIGGAEGTVASRLNRARGRLRKILERWGVSTEDRDVGAHPTR